jgi:Rv0078B-related antitoxin
VKLPADAADKLLQALELQAAGLEIMRENLERRSPHATAQEIDTAFQAWLVNQPAFDAGNPDVVVGTWPRRR